MRSKTYNSSLVNFFVFKLSLVDIVFRLATIVPWVLLLVSDSTEESKNPCRALQAIDAMCGAAFFITLALISWNYYDKLNLRGTQTFPSRKACCIFIIVWSYAAVSAIPVLISARSARYTEIQEVTVNLTEDLKNCAVPKLCDLERGGRGQFSSTWYLCLGFLIPMLAIIALNAMIAISLKRGAQGIRSTSESLILDQETTPQSSIYEKDKMIRHMLIVLSLLCVIFWGPTSVIFMLRSYKLLDDTSSDNVLKLLVSFEILKFFNSLPNPFFFWYFMPDFRDKWGSRLNCCKPPKGTVSVDNNYGSTTFMRAFSSTDA